MKKEDAISAFGSVLELSKALSITRQAVYQWPTELPQPISDRVRGAAARLGKQLPVVASRTAKKAA